MAKATRESIMGDYEAIIRTSMARTLWVTSYADYADEHPDEVMPRARNGADWDNVAPNTNFMAFEAADDLVGRIAKLNPMHAPHQMAELFSFAMMAEEGEAFSWPVSGPSTALVEEMQDFGHCMVMQSLGSGVSWFDDHKEFPVEFPNFECHYDGDEYRSLWWSGMASGQREFGFGLTTFNPGGFQKLLKTLGIKVEPGDQHVTEGMFWSWYWRGPGIELVTAYDPITGQYAEGGYSIGNVRPAKKNFASYMGVRGAPAAVKRAITAIRRNAQDIKDESDVLTFPAFGETAPGPLPVLTELKTNPDDGELEDEGPTEDDYVTTDYREWYQYRKHVLTVRDDNWQIAVELDMAKKNFWPNCWFVSDHGNPHLLSLAYDNPARVDRADWTTVAVVSADRTGDADKMSSDLAGELERTFGIKTMREATYPLWRVLGKGDPRTIAKARTFAHSWLSSEGVAATRPNPRKQRR